ncbi:Agamous-like MADS-box protein [Melia azedarach]|uniref:Agamous-like MADS-box protein n=2 Tax=Melia azedarach TaxID=155640 RepID=A0ACC1YNX0_MELAZ|nr:Agamous-like MADS-box protein [Melia azedarach]KAJ4724849.1 Agamous-like MADS-box protein [Melia azedarach]
MSGSNTNNNGGSSSNNNNNGGGSSNNNNNGSSSSNNDNQNTRKTTRGRQKIEIKKLQNKSSLQVTFSKRRTGLFSKAMELCVLCGAEVGIIVFSPNGKIFVVGHPDFDTILNRYLDENQYEQAVALPCVQQHNREYEEALIELEIEKKKAKIIEEEKEKNNGGRAWWEESIDGMGIEELEEYVKAMKKLRSKVESRVNEMMMMNEYLMPNNINIMNQEDGFGNIVSSSNNEDISANGGCTATDFDFGEHFLNNS